MKKCRGGRPRPPVCIVIIFALLCTLMAGCGEKDGSGFVFKYDIPNNPQTLDPQTATCRTSALLISNMFDGLLKVDRHGSIAANIAKEYFISDDGLTYTFLLRDDVYWYFDDDYSVQCTAHDFVFAFRRLFNPVIKSENAHLFYSIKNASPVHRGAIPHLDAVGVEARGDFELIITLEHPNPLFPYLLTTSPAMPCNEELFERTAGRYGLNAAGIPSNGAFFITRWHYDPFAITPDNNIIIMRRHEKNSENSDYTRVFPRGLNFFINDPDPLEHFLQGVVHAMIAEGEAAEALISRDYPYDGFENSVWGITFNTRRVFGNEDLRIALAAGFDRNAVNISKTGWREAREIIPPLINLGNAPYRISAGSADVLEYNPEAARAAYERGITAAGRENLTELRVIIPADENNTAFQYLSRILQEWQKNLGFFCSIETLSEDSFARALANGDYDIAMVRLIGEFNSPDAYLSRFGGAIRRSVPSPVSEFNDLLNTARRVSDIAESAPLYRRAEEILLEQAVFIPVCFQTELFFYNKRSEGLIYNPFTGTVTFREAKYFK